MECGTEKEMPSQPHMERPNMLSHTNVHIADPFCLNNGRPKENATFHFFRRRSGKICLQYWLWRKSVALDVVFQRLCQRKFKETAREEILNRGNTFYFELLETLIYSQNLQGVIAGCSESTMKTCPTFIGDWTNYFWSVDVRLLIEIPYLSFVCHFRVCSSPDMEKFTYLEPFQFLSQYCDIIF